ncbi:MAG: hypothetical protein A3C54_07115 [Deltaproteobacteria bacterium RIFCSPHIGHO2_02_FULL_60_17]|nr:MAG: hypothetical protein A3C54_07115 [Deltaproteobacteria bacterium RIFCSPHIGHO2_02_FULL_60_17]
MKKFVLSFVARALFFMVFVSSLQAQPAKMPPAPPQVWGPHLPGTDPEGTSACVKQCNAKFDKELKNCLAMEGGARADCEQPVRERHRACFTQCPK